MALRPLYMGLHFYLPRGSASSSHVGAVAHARYMVSPKKEELVRSSDPGIHARYMAERPGSSGMFGPDPEQEPALSQMVDIIQHHQGPVWRLIVSVTEEDARVLAEHSSDSLLQRSSWEQACRLVMPQIGAELGLAGLDWAAAMHRKEGHPHIHLLFWESRPRRAIGQVSTGERRQMRRLWMRELYRPIRGPLQAEKHQLRETLRNAVKGLGERSLGFGDAVMLSPADRRDLADRLMTVAPHLPEQGRLALAYMPAAVKQEVRQTALWMLYTIPEFRDLAMRYQDLAQELAQHQSDSQASHASARAHALEDLVDRISPILLRQAAEWDRAQGRMIREALMHGEPSLVDPQVIAMLHQGVRKMVYQNPRQRQETAHGVVRMATEASEGPVSAREQARMEEVLITLASRARAELVDGVADMAQGLFYGLLNEMREWEQVARFIREDRLRRRQREVMRR